MSPGGILGPTPCVMFRNIFKLLTWVFHLLVYLVIVGLPHFYHLSPTRSGTPYVLFITGSPVLERCPTRNWHLSKYAW